MSFLLWFHSILAFARVYLYVFICLYCITVELQTVDFTGRATPLSPLADVKEKRKASYSESLLFVNVIPT